MLPEFVHPGIWPYSTLATIYGTQHAHCLLVYSILMALQLIPAWKCRLAPWIGTYKSRLPYFLSPNTALASGELEEYSVKNT